MNSLHFSPFKGEFFVFFILPEWILCIFDLVRMNSLLFSTVKGEFFAFFTLKGWIFLFFILHGWIFYNFHPWRWILYDFFPLRLDSLQFSPFKSEIFAIFVFLRYFLGERDKKLLLQWWILWTFGFYFSDWGFSFWNSACVLFLSKITHFLLGDLLTFFIPQACTLMRLEQTLDRLIN